MISPTAPESTTAPHNVAAGAAMVAYALLDSLAGNGEISLRAEEFTNARASVHTALKVLTAFARPPHVIEIEAEYGPDGGRLAEGASIEGMNGEPIALVVSVKSDLPIPQALEHYVLDTLPLIELASVNGAYLAIIVYIIETVPPAAPSAAPLQRAFNRSYAQIFSALDMMLWAEKDWEGLPPSLLALDEPAKQWIAAALASEDIGKVG